MNRNLLLDNFLKTISIVLVLKSKSYFEEIQ